MNKALAFGLVVTAAACSGGESVSSVSTIPPPSGMTPISEIQGTGSESAFEGQTVTVSGVVTGDFQDNDADPTRNLGGYFIQQENPDTDPLSSEGLFVFEGNTPVIDIDVGDRVEVTGTVGEHFGETQIGATSVSVTGRGVIQPTEVNLPVAGVTSNSDGEMIADLERYEGMLVRFPQTLTVRNLRFLEQFGEVGLSAGGRVYQFTNRNAPDRAAYGAHVEAVAARSISLDDGLRTAYPEDLPYLTAGPSASYSIRMGDTINGATGNLRFSRGSGGGGNESWRLMPTETIVFSDDNPRPGVPSVAGTTRIASANVLNFFSGIDSGQAICGPQSNDNCRGADSAAELDRQLAKTSAALAMLDADIVGLVELENNPSASIRTIVDAVNNRVGSARYDFIDTGVIGDDAIKTGFIFDATTISPAGSFALLDASVDPRFNDSRNRPALAQTFEVLSSGAKLTVVVNHLKSKGSNCDADGDPNTGDGQGNCNITRRDAAAAIADWIATDPTGSGDPDYLVIGDLNAYMMEDPLTALKNGGLTNLLDQSSDPYSFSFDGQSGALDHALATTSLAGQVSQAIEWHINSDEPSLLDYNLENGRDAALFDPDSPYRAADHDPIIIDLDLTNW